MFTALALALAASPAQDQRADLLEMARRQGSFNTLLTAIELTGLRPALEAPVPLTLFAPTDAAFAALPPGLLDSLLLPQNRSALREVLEAHVVGESFEAIAALRAGTLETLGGLQVDVTIDDGALYVGGARMSRNDIPARNGVLHAIDGVLVPAGLDLRSPTQRVVEIAIERGVPLFNDGQIAACVAIYEVAALGLIEYREDALPAAVRAQLMDAVNTAQREPDARSSAWDLRRALDRALAAPAAVPTRKSDAATLFSFDGAANDARWFTLNDDVMGGVSKSAFELAPGGIGVFRGALSMDNNGGFATIRSADRDLGLAGFTGLRLRVRGDGRTYGLSALKTDSRRDVRAWRRQFRTTNSEWMELEIPFADLTLNVMGRSFPDVDPLDPATIRSFSFIVADKNEDPFRLEIDWIRAYR